MTDTPNHNYNTPTEGTTDWHIPLNANFDRLDTDIEIRGPERDKGEYEPKQGTKYEATDTGAVYYGNGTSWMLADRKLNSIGANNINGVKVPDGNDIDAFRNASEGGGTVRLRPDVTYEWDETFTFDPADGYNLRVEARHAEIRHTSDPMVDIKTSVGETSRRMTWEGGFITGPGKEAGDSVDPGGEPSYAPDIGTGTSTFRLTDAYSHTIRPGTVRDVKAAIYVRNMENWSEGNKLGHTRDTGGAGEREFSCDFIILCLGGDYLEDGSGGGSMRNIQIQLDWGYGTADIANVYQGNAGWQGGEVTLRGNPPQDGWGWFSDGNLEGTAIHYEGEFGSSDSVSIEFAGDALCPPPFHFRDPDGRIENNRSGNIFYFARNGGLKSVDGKKGYQIQFDKDRWVWESNTRIEPGSFRANTSRNITNYDGGHREIVYYDGRNETVDAPAGYYWYDNKGDLKENHWILMGDAETTVSPD